LNEKNSIINEFEHRISELQCFIRDRERQIRTTNDKLQQTEQNFDVGKKTRFLLNFFSYLIFC